MKIAVYSGTFDPITKGHVDIATRAAQLFDQVIIAVAADNYKNTLFSLEERCEMAKIALDQQENIIVEPFSGLLVDYCHEKNATSIVRGLRAVSDFDREFQMALMNRDLNGGIDTVFLMSDANYMYLSSTIIRQTAMVGGDVVKFVPEHVYEALLDKYPALKARCSKK